MNSNFIYKLLSGVYDLLDIIYFCNYDNSPRKVIQDAKRVLKDDGRMLVMEWEPSKVLWRRILFLPIHLLEPKPYRTFIKKDLKKYFQKHGLEIEKISHCDYTEVLCLSKIM